MLAPQHGILAGMGFEATGHRENAGAVIVLQELSVGVSHVFENTIVHHQSNHLSVTEGFMQLQKSG